MSSKSKVTVLLVDDTDAIRLLLRMVLNTADDFEVIAEAANGEEAVSAAARTKPDIILLDVAMPVMDGLQALPRLRRESPNSIIVMVTGFMAEALSEEVTSLGASGYIEKGTSPPVILATLREIAGLSPHPPAPAGPLRHANAASSLPDGTDQGSHDDALHQMLAVLSHELLSPVASVLGLAQMLETSRRDMRDDEMEECIQGITRSSRHMQTLIMKFWDSYRAGVDALQLAREPIVVDNVVRSTVADLRAVHTSHPIQMNVETGAATLADPIRIRQVITNLVGNAAKFSPAYLPIEIVGQRVDDHVEISVIDSGPGIPAERQLEVFNKYTRLSSRVEGTGIGLYVSKAIAMSHGGDLLLDSTEGKGSRFTLVLPIVENQ